MLTSTLSHLTLLGPVGPQVAVHVHVQCSISKFFTVCGVTPSVMFTMNDCSEGYEVTSLVGAAISQWVFFFNQKNKNNEKKWIRQRGLWCPDSPEACFHCNALFQKHA